MKKKPAKKPVTKPKVTDAAPASSDAQPADAPPSPENVREAETAVMLMINAASRITSMDCAAFAMLEFYCGEVTDEEWHRRGVEAMKKFVDFGWSAFHSLGGLHVDWNKAADKLRDNLLSKLPRVTPEKKE